MGEKAYTASFASIYDDIMGAVPYQLWYDYLHDLMKYYKLRPEKVLELACGTGNMSLLFSMNSYQVSGIDISEEMLNVAKEKAKNMQMSNDKPSFLKKDLRDFSLNEKYDFAFSLFDSLNYILEYEELYQVFQNTYRVLNKDACFIFDMNTISRLMSIKNGTTVLNGDNYSCIWEDKVDKKKELWQVKLKIYLEEKGDYFEEFHQERGYPIIDVVAALKKAGFKQVEVYNAYTFEEAKESDNRIYFIAFLGERAGIKRTAIHKKAKNIKWKMKKMINTVI